MELVFPNPWLLGLGITLFSYLVIYGIKKLFCTKISKLFSQNHNRWDEIFFHTLAKTSHFFMIGLSLYIAYRVIPHPPKYNIMVGRIFFAITMLQVGIWSNHLVDKWINGLISRKTRKNPAAASSISLIQLTTKILLISIIFLMTLNNMGIKVTTILAGFGVGGIAVALALQKILGDFFSSLSIVMDKPFVVGDFIIIDQYLGEVEKIGLRTTHLRSLGGEQIIISNSDIMAARIRNYKRMKERRIVQVLNFPLDSGPEAMRKAVSIISAIISSKDRLRLERCHFSAINKTSLDVETVYWVLSEDYNIHMDLLQEILLEIYQALTLEGMRFAYPTQTVHMEPKEFFQNQSSSLKNSQSSPDHHTVS